MTHHVASIRDKPIYVVTLDHTFDLKLDTPAITTEVEQMLDNVGEPIAIIYDLRALRMSLGDTFAALGLSIRGGAHLSAHPMLAKLLIVTSNDRQKLAAAAFGSSAVAGSSIETAVNDARRVLKSVNVR